MPAPCGDPGGFVSGSYNLIGDPYTAGTFTNGTNGNIVGHDDGSSGRALLDPTAVFVDANGDGKIDASDLADYGGPTKTLALAAGSVAVDAGDPAAVAGVAGVPQFDQRGDGYSRVRAGRIDIGAFELQQLYVTGTDPAEGSVVVGSAPTQYIVNVSDPLDSATVQASDFQVNGIDATGVSYTAGSSSVTFTFDTTPLTTQGVETMHIDAGAFERASDGRGVKEFSGTFRWDAVLMQVTSTDPAEGSTILLPATTLDLNFNEAYDFSSAQPSDFTLNQGSVSAVSQVDADTLRLTLDGLTSEGTLTVNMTAGAMTDVYGNPGAGFSASYTLDFGSYPYPVPLTPKAPLGSLIYDPSISGVISPAGDTDTFTINVDPGQTITVAVQTDPGLQASVTLLAGATGKVVVATGTTSGAGQEVVVGPVATDGELNSDGQPAKTYRIVVAGANDTTGHYTVQFALNTALEDESHGGATNDTVATAQSLEPSFVQLHRATNADNSGPQPARAAVLGTLEPVPGTFSSIVDSEDFESGSLGAQWTTYSSQYNGRIRVTGAYGTAGGNYALLMDTSHGSYYSYNLNEAVWTVDLSGQTQATLQFAHRNFGDELNYLPANFTGHYAGDGVAISDDGVHWHTVLNATSISSNWQTVKIDLAAEAAAAGITLGPNFQIKFQQYDNYPLTTDGRGYDNIVIGVPTPAQDTYSFSLQAGESATLTLNGSANLELQDATGATLALATTGASNVDQAIRNFIASADGTYYARVSSVSETASDYTLLVTRNADFDTENNNSIASAQHVLSNQVAGQQWVLGSLGGGGAGGDLSNVHNPAYVRSDVGAPWGSTSNETAMNRVFGTGHWQDLRFETVNTTELFSNAHNFVFLEGSDNNANELESFLSVNQTRIEQYVAAGNTLIVNAAPNEGNGMSFGFGDVQLVYPTFSYSDCGRPGTRDFSGSVYAGGDHLHWQLFRACDCNWHWAEAAPHQSQQSRCFGRKRMGAGAGRLRRHDHEQFPLPTASGGQPLG